MDQTVMHDQTRMIGEDDESKNYGSSQVDQSRLLDDTQLLEQTVILNKRNLIKETVKQEKVLNKTGRQMNKTVGNIADPDESMNQGIQNRTLVQEANIFGMNADGTFVVQNTSLQEDDKEDSSLLNSKREYIDLNMSSGTAGFNDQSLDLPQVFDGDQIKCDSGTMQDKDMFMKKPPRPSDEYKKSNPGINNSEDKPADTSKISWNYLKEQK